MSYSAADVVNKVLKTRERVECFRGSEAHNNGTPFGTIAPGMSIGVVKSWLDKKPDEGRSHLYWEFDHQTYGTFYVRHAAGTFDVKDLREQGLLTIQEIAAQEAEENLDPWQRGERAIKYAVSALVFGGIIQAAIK